VLQPDLFEFERDPLQAIQPIISTTVSIRARTT